MNNESMIVSLKGSPNKNETVLPEAKKKRDISRFVGPLFLGLLVLGGGTTLYVYRGVFSGVASDAESSKQAAVAAVAGATSAEKAQDAKVVAEIEDIIQKVGKHIRLPKDEVPTVATVSDPEKLKSQSFFANAKVGNKVLIYTKAHKAYLFDVEADILIEVAPITIDSIE